jgi:hypothetical protein
VRKVREGCYKGQRRGLQQQILQALHYGHQAEGKEQAMGKGPVSIFAVKPTGQGIKSLAHGAAGMVNVGQQGKKYGYTQILRLFKDVDVCKRGKYSGKGNAAGYVVKSLLFVIKV